MIVIPDMLSQQELVHIRARLEQAQWHDGRETAGHTAVAVKSNEQLRARDETAIELGRLVLGILSGNARFVSFALPSRILTPMFNRYQGGGEYGFHIDNAVRVDPVTGERIRTDISLTLFLNDPDDYDGGELILNDACGIQKLKLPAGHAVVYPATSLHRVSPVTRGKRLASFFWVQSMIRDASQRKVLFDLDNAIQQLALRPDNGDELTQLTGIYHNLVRLWAHV